MVLVLKRQSIRKKLCKDWLELLSNGDPAVWGSVSDTLGLPKFQVDGKFFLNPIAFIIENDRVVEIFDQAKAPEQNANDVLAWFYNQQAQA